MSVPESLESHQVLLSVFTSTRAELEVNLVRGGEGIVPAVRGEAGLPCAIIRDINSDATLVVGCAWCGNGVSLAAFALSFELVKKVLLSSGSPGRAEGDSSVAGSDGIKRIQSLLLDEA